MHAWEGESWELISFTGGAAFEGGEPSSIVLRFPKSLLGNPEFLNVAVVSTGRGRVHTAGDILGTEFSPASWDEMVILEDFIRIDLVK